jgi:hypothetical protein
MTKLLHVSPELGLPLEVLSDSTAIVGRKRTGKSNTAAVMVEEAIDAGAQVVIFDPKGDWWGLRSSADGDAAGYPIVVIGGSHAMLPLNPLAGVAVADWIIDSGYSVVLDISEIETNAETDRFVSDLLKQLRKRKKAKPGAIAIVIDEADELAPQDTRFGSAFLKTLGLVVWMVKRGGFLGIGTIVVTQRPASLSKNVLTQTELLVALQTMGEQDIDAIDGWFKHHVSKEQRAEILANIAKLEKGEGYVLSGQILKGVFRIHFRRRRTFDSGATPTMGETVAQPKVVADVDLAKLSEAMAAAVEEVTRTDPEILRKRIRELEAQIASAQHGEKVVTRVEHERIEVPVLADGALEQIRAIATDLLEASTKLYDGGRLIQDAIYPVVSEMQRVAPSADPSNKTRDDGSAVRAAAPRPASPSTERPPGKPVRSGEPRATEGASQRMVTGITPTMQRILDSVALLEHRGAEISVTAIAAVAGVHPNGGRFRGDLKALQSAELLDASYGLTERSRAGANVDDKITAGQQKILDTLGILEASHIEADPKTIAAWLDLNVNGGRYRGDLKQLQITGLLDGYRRTSAARRLTQTGLYGLGAAMQVLDPSTARLLELVRDHPKGLSVTEAAAKLNLHPNGGRFRSSIGRLFEMGLIRSKSELALSDAMRQEVAA